MKSLLHFPKNLFSNCLAALFSLLLLFGYSAIAQDVDKTNKRAFHNEIESDPYVAMDKSKMQLSPAYNVTETTYFTRQVNVDINGNNIVGDAGNEPSIAVDPTNPDRIVIGWRQFDNISSNFRQAGNGYSLDGGETWVFQEVLEPGVFRSDPVLDFDAQGNLYYNSLQSGFACDVFKITDGGQDWGSPFPAFGGDKQWMALDRSGGSGDGNNYSYWNSSFSTCTGQFTRSSDGSNTFEDCVFIDSDPFWGTLTVDSDGNLYVVGDSNIGLALIKSSNAQIDGSTITWDFATPVDLDGSLNFQQPVNPVGLLGQMWVGTDLSTGSGNGNIYALASVTRFSNSDPADVMFAKSTDGGLTFLPPVRINNDISTTNYQWFGTMSVAPNGRIDVVWLDTREAPVGTNDSVLYYSFSVNQGDSWTENMAISVPFDPNIGYPQQNKMGDYFHMTSDNDFAHLAWANTINGGQDVYYTRITPDISLGVNDYVVNNPLQFISYPNPFSNQTTIEFNVPSEEQVTISVIDVQGRKITTLFNERTSGKQTVEWNGTNGAGAEISSGIYFITITSENNNYVSKIIRQ